MKFVDDKEKASFFLKKSNFNIILHESKPQSVSSKHWTAFEHQQFYKQI